VGIVIDPTTNSDVNGSFQAFATQEIRIDIAPHGAVRIGLVVHTASSVPALGYAIPPGTWQVQVLIVANGRRLLAPKFPMMVTGRNVAPSVLWAGTNILVPLQLAQMTISLLVAIYTAMFSNFTATSSTQPMGPRRSFTRRNHRRSNRHSRADGERSLHNVAGRLP
jgi:hypothetical protein